MFIQLMELNSLAKQIIQKTPVKVGLKQSLYLIELVRAL